MTTTPDERIMFAGIQHPGEAPVGANNPANPNQFSSVRGLMVQTVVDPNWAQYTKQAIEHADY